MNISQVSSQSFGNLVYGYGIQKQILGKKSSRAINLKLQKITKQIKDEKLDSLNNVDIILNYEKSDGFYGIISSKKQGVPNNPSYRFDLNRSEGSMSNFVDWAKDWDSAYSPEEIDKLHKLLKYVKNV